MINMIKLFSIPCFVLFMSYYNLHVDAKSIAAADYPEIKDHLDEFISIEEKLADELKEKTEKLEKFESQKRSAAESKKHFSKNSYFNELIFFKLCFLISQLNIRAVFFV